MIGFSTPLLVHEQSVYFKPAVLLTAGVEKTVHDVTAPFSFQSPVHLTLLTQWPWTIDRQTDGQKGTQRQRGSH